MESHLTPEVSCIPSTSSLSEQKLVGVDAAVLKRIRHLDASGGLTFRDSNARGQGAFSEVFMGRCRIKGLGEVDVAVKRLRFHVDSDDFTQVNTLVSNQLTIK